ncbi:DUF2147 domain-containing protein [Labrenzia sp. VG12]|uniref:DUF2147 domain-containing protein n=1 Tax=Labrenzia sp. VG12 TaxID=2021862 RepID=UPI000B8BFE32|nr:DUF2147 domain-containing protein [Labrenzia sp. VG12]ASP36555.1 hypothetical protein CHH27_01250 [Labrenzia sp. VG12]
MTDFFQFRFRQSVLSRFQAGLLAVPLLAAATANASAAPDINGTWKTPAGALVEIKACGNEPCGRIVDFPAPKGYTVQSTPDLNNKDESKRSRKILGLKVLWRLKPASNSWKGRAYDPRRGFSANATVRKTNANTLEVQGCVRVVFNVCEKETWRRVK